MSNGDDDPPEMGATCGVRANWLSSFNWQVDFYEKSNRKTRVDSEFDWAWLERRQRRFGGAAASLLRGLVGRFRARESGGVSQEWVNRHANLLWGARALLEDDLSKLLFDSVLILRCSSYGRFYFPRIDFEPFVSVVSEGPFLSNDLPLDYLGLPLRVFVLERRRQPHLAPMTVVSTRAQINLLNSYRQYFVQRGAAVSTPVADDVVLDCGACIGEVSVLIAGLVGPHGQVHLFDPVPLHARYCRLQASLNPALAHVLHVNVLAVGDTSREASGLRADATSISPGRLCIDSYSVTSLDDYVFGKGLTRVDVIKMDIEGAEMAALEGASRVIQTFKPRLAISAYHKPADLWEIPDKLRTQRGDYRLFFGHHSPMEWESVYYAA